MASFHSGHAGQHDKSARHGAVTTSNTFTALSLPEPVSAGSEEGERGKALA